MTPTLPRCPPHGELVTATVRARPPTLTPNPYESPQRGTLARSAPNLDCHNCDKFVLSGADLLYWRRKREQWRLLAEGAPDDATADYLHRYFEPTARAIDGLEKALAGLGLLDDALALDLRKPQDYFHRVWSTAFRAADLADVGHSNGEYGDTCTANGDDPGQDAA
ncbi:hypothetical protein [Streptomyces sp. H27-D2]|uniref:hypothetical protein n=1 Tax=Streptomyces sp. H27-D2 TaxID=3046304 RepID=UPI002DB73393|nr:hypothetical protein [Streptomyces sp. H27-D2]MEC4019799.1 hypothetical protein [Streptomyces sp. H27-D2]